MKNQSILLLLATALVSPMPGPAQITLNNSLEAFVRGGAANADTDQNEATIGYIMVKYDAGLSVARKAYFKFDFTGQSPNTNAVLKLKFTTFTNNQRQHVQLWTLDQDYPAFNSPVLTWNNAQANETNSNSLLTSGAATATARTDFITPNSAGQNPTYVIPPPWGDALINDKLHIVLATLSDPTNAANGTRISLNTTALEFIPITSGSPPSMSAIADLITVATLNSDTNSFTVGDPDEGPTALSLSAVSANEAIVPSANVFLGGSGANRTVYVVGTSPGTTTITVTVTDSAGNPADRLFKVTVLPLDFAPGVSTPAPTNTPLNLPVTVPFTVSDGETAATNLVVTGEIASYSAGILASLTLGVDETGTNRTVTITPQTDANGVGVVNLYVSDEAANVTKVSFAVMVLAAPNVIFNDHFDYPDATVGLFPGSAGLWSRRSVSPGNVNFSTQSGTAYIRPKSNADDGAAALAGGPYPPSSRAVLYARCSATWIDVGAELATNSAGHFFALSQFGSATTVNVAEVATSTNLAPENTFNLGLNDVLGVVHPNTNVAVPLLGGPYTIITRYEVARGRSTLWVNATSEADPHVTATDTSNPLPIGYVGLRQDLGMGYIFVDDLQVVLAIEPLLTSATPPMGGNVDLFFSAGLTDVASDFTVEGSSLVTGAYGNLTANITALGNGNFKATVPAISATEGYYRVKRAIRQF